MRLEQILIFAVLCCISIFMIVYYVRHSHPVKSALFGSASGLAAFLGAKFLFSLFGIVLPLNLFSLLFSLTLGVPGVTMLSLLHLVS